MRIKNLQVKDFLGIKAISLNLSGGVHLFSGENGNGKSSIRDAISWGIADHVRGLVKSKDYAAIIRHGEKRAELIMDVSGDDGKVLRVEKKRTKTVSSGISRDAVAGFIGTDAGAIRACLDAWEFRSFSKEEREKIVKSAFGGKRSVNIDMVKKLLIPYHVEGKYDSWIIEKVSSGEDFNLIHDAAIAERVAAKRALKEIGDAVDVPEMAKIGGKDQKISLLVDLDNQKSFADRVREYTNERESLLQKIGGMKAVDPKEKRREIEERLISYRTSSFSDSDEIMLKRLRDAGVDRAARVDEIEGEIRKLHDALAEGGLVDCPISDVSGNKCCPACVSAEHAENRKRVSELTAECERYRDEIKRVESLEKLEAGLKSIQAELKKIDSEQDDGGAESNIDEIAKIQNEIDELALRIDNSRAGSNAIIDFFYKKELAEKTEKKRIDVSAEIEAWESVVKAVSPDGIRNGLNAGGVSVLNKRLAMSFEMVGFEFILDENFEPVISDGRVFSLLSRSEQWRVGAAIAEAIAYGSGLRFFCIDECDVLVQGAQRDFATWVFSLMPDYDQIFLFASSKEKPRFIPIENFHVWHVVDGSAELVDDSKLAA